METELKSKVIKVKEDIDLNDLLKKTKNQHILEIYSEMQKDLKRLVKVYTDGNLYDTHTYHAIKYMEVHYKEIIDKFENKDNLFEL